MFFYSIALLLSFIPKSYATALFPSCNHLKLELELELVLAFALHLVRNLTVFCLFHGANNSTQVKSNDRHYELWTTVLLVFLVFLFRFLLLLYAKHFIMLRQTSSNSNLSLFVSCLCLCLSVCVCSWVDVCVSYVHVFNFSYLQFSSHYKTVI